jgi:hypothetical protein
MIIALLHVFLYPCITLHCMSCTPMLCRLYEIQIFPKKQKSNKKSKKSKKNQKKKFAKKINKFLKKSLHDLYSLSDLHDPNGLRGIDGLCDLHGLLGLSHSVKKQGQKQVIEQKSDLGPSTVTTEQ